jgi:hypothetical protein
VAGATYVGRVLAFLGRHLDGRPAPARGPSGASVRAGASPV